MNRLNRQHVAKMYCDLKDGISRHVGYIIAKKWISVYKVFPFKDNK